MTSVQDRYARSITSSHLEVTEFAGDIDSLIASGWIQESLSTMLWRLRVEYDAVDARELNVLPEMPPPDRLLGEEGDDNEVAARQQALAKWKKEEAERIVKDLAARRLMAKALAMVHMTSLSAAKEALGRFVMATATRTRLDITTEDQLRLSGRILSHFLDPLCTACHGVKYKTVPGTGRLSAMSCDHCEGSGRERLRFTGNTSAAEYQFTQSVLAELDRKMDRVARLMQRFLRERAEMA